MKLNNKILAMDLKASRNTQSKSEATMCEEIGIKRSTVYRLKQGKLITMDTFCKCITWLDADVNRYFG